jgi:hypothetical protein
MTELL